MSAWDVIRADFEDWHSQAFMLWMAFMTVQPCDRPGTGVLAYSLVYGRQQHSWTLPRGGSAALPLALARLVEDHGGSVVTGARVSGLVLEDGRCVGVETEGGETLPGDAGGRLERPRQAPRRDGAARDLGRGVPLRRRPLARGRLPLPDSLRDDGGADVPDRRRPGHAGRRRRRPLGRPAAAGRLRRRPRPPRRRRPAAARRVRQRRRRVARSGRAATRSR